MPIGRRAAEDFVNPARRTTRPLDGLLKNLTVTLEELAPWPPAGLETIWAHAGVSPAESNEIGPAILPQWTHALSRDWRRLVERFPDTNDGVRAAASGSADAPWDRAPLPSAPSCDNVPTIDDAIRHLCVGEGLGALRRQIEPMIRLVLPIERKHDLGSVAGIDEGLALRGGLRSRRGPPPLLLLSRSAALVRSARCSKRAHDDGRR